MATSYSNSSNENPEIPRLDQKYVDERIDEITRDKSIFRVDAIDNITDSEWVDQAITATVTLEGDDVRSRFISSADSKFQDTSVGGNWVINPLPQFTHYADPPSKGLVRGRDDVSPSNPSARTGMGAYYSEAYDDTKQVIHMRFGVPEYNSMLSFFTGFYDNSAASLARTGSLIGDAAAVIGQAGALVLNIVFWPLMAAHAIGRAYRFFAQKPASKYYYLRPTMSNYWTAVTTMLNTIAVNMRISPIDYDNAERKIESARGSKENANIEVDQSLLQSLQEALPGIYTESGFIDVYKIANRAQKIMNKVESEIDAALGSNGIWDAWDSISNIQVSEADGDNSGLAEAQKRWFSSKSGKSEMGNEDKIPIGVRTPQIPVDEGSNTISVNMANEDSSLLDVFHAEFNDGSQFATFRVDYTGSVDESFSNSATDSDIASKFNQLSAQGREARFSFMEGNVGGGLGAITDAFSGFVGGALQGLHLSGLMSLAGSAFVDIPRHWDSSSASPPRMNYTMQLVSPYGNPISQLINIHLPLCMLLAAALPISTGSQSYTSPFLVELHDRGKAMTRLGMIDSLSITRGTTNLGYNKRKSFMSADVSFSVVDLSTVMHMPLTSGFFNWANLSPATIFNDDNNFSDYMYVLAGASVSQTLYKGQKLRDRSIQYFRRLQALTSADRWAMMIHDSPIGMLDMFFRGTGRE